MSNRQVRTDSEKRAALRVVGREMRWMAWASIRLAQADPAGDAPSYNAYIDSTHLHARALIDFFVRTPRFKSDIWRTDLAPDWTPAPADAADRLVQSYPVMNILLAHMTWERVDKATPNWNYPNIADDIIEVADAWLVHLTADNPALGHLFETQLNMARNALNGL